MATPVTPRYFAEEVVLRQINIQYNPVWNGTQWVIDPATIKVTGVGELTDLIGNAVIQADISEPATALPPAGLSALQDLYQYIEAELAAKYS